jgi:hypothetical protein
MTQAEPNTVVVDALNLATVVDEARNETQNEGRYEQVLKQSVGSLTEALAENDSSVVEVRRMDVATVIDDATIELSLMRECDEEGDYEDELEDALEALQATMESARQ